MSEGAKTILAITVVMAAIGCVPWEEKAKPPVKPGCYEIEWCIVPELKINGKNVRGLALRNADGEYRSIVTPATDPYSCLGHEGRHVVEGDFHDPKDTTNIENCIR